jgi:hypothetical protein
MDYIRIRAAFNEQDSNRDASNTEACMSAPAVPDDCVITLALPDVSKTFKQVNIHRQTGKFLQ